MATRHVVHTGGLTSGTASTLGTAWTLAHACGNAVAGDVNLLAPGNYGTQRILPTVSGTSEVLRVTFRASGPGVIFNATTAPPVDLTANAWITVDGIHFNSTRPSWVDVNTSSPRFTLINCTFASADPPGGDWTTGSFVGILLRGAYAIVRNCIVGVWMGGDTLRGEGDFCLVDHNGFDYNDSGHGSIIMNGEYYVVQDNYVRNKWARGGHFAPGRFDAGTQRGGVVQRNDFFDCNYTDLANDGYPVDGEVVDTPDGDPIGDANMIKGGGTGLIFRDNMVVASNPSGYATHPNWQYRCVLQINNYDDTVYWEHGRYYHNVFLANGLHGVTVNAASGANAHAFEVDDNRFYNNILHQNDNRSLRLTDASLVATHQHHNNIMTDPIHYGASSSMTVAQFEAARGAAHASGNIGSAPTFVNGNFAAENANRALRIDRNNFALASSSPVGRGAARHLANVTATSATTVIAVDDAWPFTNGNGIIPGDVIIVNGQTRSIQSTSTTPGAQTITVDQVTSVVNGNPIWLTAFGVSPDIGIAATPAEETPTWQGTITRLTTKKSVITATSLTTDAFAPAANSHLLVTIGFNHSISGNPTPNIGSITTTLANVGAWTAHPHSVRESGTDSCIVAFSAQISGSPGTGTITAHAINSTPTQWVIEVLQITGNRYGTPIINYLIGNGASTTPTLTTAAPTAGNAQLAAINSRADPDFNVSPGTGFTELLDESSSASGHVQLQMQYRGSDLTTAVGWTGAHTSGNVFFALEIVAAEEDGVVYPIVSGEGISSVIFGGQIVR